MAVVALIYSLTTFRKSLQAAHYTELDKMYNGLLRTAIEKPHLVSTGIPRSKDQGAEYDIYAFMVWNFLEAIYDRCEADHGLRGTWYPVIDTEAQRHRAWFEQPENHDKFKPKFHAFVRKRFAKASK